MTEQWEEIEVPRGTFIGWGRVGQEVIGRVLSYAPSGGSDFNGQPCPALNLELLAPCDNYTEKGSRQQRVDKGELVVLNAGQVNLKKGVIAAQPEPGDGIKITFANVGRTDKGEYKEFKVAVSRSASSWAMRSPSHKAR